MNDSLLKLLCECFCESSYMFCMNLHHTNVHLITTFLYRLLSLICSGCCRSKLSEIGTLLCAKIRYRNTTITKHLYRTKVKECYVWNHKRTSTSLENWGLSDLLFALSGVFAAIASFFFIGRSEPSFQNTSNGLDGKSPRIDKFSSHIAVI